jgi:hypothetical protein
MLVLNLVARKNRKRMIHATIDLFDIGFQILRRHIAKQIGMLTLLVMIILFLILSMGGSVTITLIRSFLTPPYDLPSFFWLIVLLLNITKFFSNTILTSISIQEFGEKPKFPPLQYAHIRTLSFVLKFTTIFFGILFSLTLAHINLVIQILVQAFLLVLYFIALSVDSIVTPLEITYNISLNSIKLLRSPEFLQKAASILKFVAMRIAIVAALIIYVTLIFSYILAQVFAKNSEIADLIAVFIVYMQVIVISIIQLLHGIIERLYYFKMYNQVNGINLQERIHTLQNAHLDHSTIEQTHEANNKTA